MYSAYCNSSLPHILRQRTNEQIHSKQLNSLFSIYTSSSPVAIIVKSTKVHIKQCIFLFQLQGMHATIVWRTFFNTHLGHSERTHTYTTTKNYYFLLKLLLCDNHHADHEDDMHNITAKKKTRHDMTFTFFSLNILSISSHFANMMYSMWNSYLQLLLLLFVFFHFVKIWKCLLVNCYFSFQTTPKIIA